VTLRSISGLLVYNVFVLGAGAGVLWGVRGWRWWTDFVRLAGVAYLLGFASLMILLTFEIVVGVPVNLATILLSGIVLVAVGLLVGRLRGQSSPALRPPGWRFPGLSLFSALFVAGIVVYFEGLFRADRLAGTVREWDSWAFWMPRAKEIYFFGRLEPEFLLLLPQRPSYPPGLATIQAGALHAAGSADTVSLHVQYWFFAVGFVAAVTGLLVRRVHHAILFPVLLLFLVAPSLVERITSTYADVPLGYLVAGAALLMVLWLEEQKTWQLATATLLLAGAMLTKREGMLFAACVLLAAFVASWSDRRLLWRRLAVAGFVAFALTVPWRIWFTAHGLPGDGPDTGYLGSFTALERVWPSSKLVVTTLFDQDLWRFVPALAVAAVVLALLAGAWRISVYTGVLIGAAVAASTWAIWSNPMLEFTQDDNANPVVRVTGTTILALAVLTPLLLQQAWSGRRGERRSPSRVATLGADAFISRSTAAWAIVLVGVLSHPVSMLVGYSGSGLPGGLPRLPGTADCISAPAPGEPVRIVVGYADSYPEANAMRERALRAGLSGTEVAHDGCGRLRVFVDDLPTVGSSQALMAEAQAASLEPSLELDPDD
jgi:hypothetical protein